MPKIEDFDLLEIIGTGSYSTVHRARNKVCAPRFFSDETSQTTLLLIAGHKQIFCNKMCGKSEYVDQCHG